MNVPCWLAGHKWTKWTTFARSYRRVIQGKTYDAQCESQRRECMRCGIREQRDVTDYA